jgi:hypothetical protein
MDYQAEIIEIKAKIAELEVNVKAVTVEERIVIRNQITALENKSTMYAQLLLPQNATSGNYHSI